MTVVRSGKTVNKIVLLLLIGPSILWAQTPDPTNPAQANSSTSSQQSSAVRIDVPRPSPQQFPNSSVLPSGVDTVGAEYPSKYQEEKTDRKARHGEWVIAPIPFSNEAFSFGLAPVVEYVFHTSDQQSPPSSLVLAGMVATRSSWALGGGGSLYLKQDRFRITAFGGHGTVGYDIFGVGNAGGDQGQTIPIRQGGSLVLLEVLFRLKGKFYLEIGRAS